jgi:hypothetical protein
VVVAEGIPVAALVVSARGDDVKAKRVPALLLAMAG